MSELATRLKVVPANEARCEDFETLLGTRVAAATCQCQRYRLKPKEAFSKFPTEELPG
jgi:hypothetical protein